MLCSRMPVEVQRLPPSKPASTAVSAPRFPVITHSRRTACHAAPEQQPGPSGTQTTDVESESRLEAMEAAIRNKGKKAAESQMARGRPMQIRGQQAKKAAEPEVDPDDNSGLAPWRENELFPQGWDKMNPVQKVSELYLGRRGMLFWANKLAFGAAMTLIGAWVAFRIVGPALGLYTLQGDLTSTLK